MGPAVFLSQTLSLLLELAIFRFLSFEHFHRFASVAVGVALAGYGFSGFLLYMLGRRDGRFYRPEPYVFAFPLSITMAIVFLYFLNVEPSHLLVSPEKAVLLFLLFLFLSAPFSVSGAIVGSAFASFEMSKFRVYALSMVGAGSGVILWFLLSPLIPLRFLLALIILCSTLMIFMSRKERKGALWKRLLMCLLSFTGILSLFSGPLPISEYKALSQYRRVEGEKVLGKTLGIEGEYIVGITDYFHILPGLSPRYRGAIPEQVLAFLDGSICGWSFLPSPADHIQLLRHMPEIAPFFHEGREAFIAGYESGVLQAMASDSGYERVTVADSRKVFLSLMGRVGTFDHERVNIIPRTPHLYIRKTGLKFDVIYIPEAGSLSYAMVYGKPLSEDYLLTEEGLRLAAGRLKKGGIFAVSGWSKNPLREEGKILNLFRKVLGPGQSGEFSKNVIVVYGYSRFVIIVAGDSFQAKFVDKVKTFLSRTGFSGIIQGDVAAGDFRDRTYEESILSTLAGDDGSGEDSPFFLLAPTYDRPYFYRFFRLGRVAEIYRKLGKTALVFIESGYIMLLLSLFFVAITGFCAILLPSLLVLHAFAREKAASYRLLILGVLCGIGYTIVEMVFVGRAPFFFDSYTEGFLIVVAIFLTSSGLGAYFGEQIMKGKHMRYLIISVVMVSLFSLVALLPVSAESMRHMSPSIERIAFAAICMSVSFLLGLYFPPILQEMQIVSGNEGLVALWGINNFSSLMGSLITPVITVSYGFAAAFAGVGAVYLIFSILYLVRRGKGV